MRFLYGEDFRFPLGNENCALELSTSFKVRCDSGPAVFPSSGAKSPHVNHRLYSENHARFEYCPKIPVAIVWHLRRHVKTFPHAVAAEILDNTVTVAVGVSFYGAPDPADAFVGTGCGDTQIHTFPRDFQQILRIFVNVANCDSL